MPLIWHTSLLPCWVSGNFRLPRFTCSSLSSCLWYGAVFFFFCQDRNLLTKLVQKKKWKCAHFRRRRQCKSCQVPRCPRFTEHYFEHTAAAAAAWHHICWDLSFWDSLHWIQFFFHWDNNICNHPIKKWEYLYMNNINVHWFHSSEWSPRS